MSNRREIPHGQCLGFARQTLVPIDWHFLVGEVFGEQASQQVRLESKTVRIRVPAADVIGARDKQPVVVMHPIAADRVDQSRVGLRKQPTKGAASTNLHRVGNHDFGLSHRLENGFERLDWFDIVTADHAIPLALGSEGRLSIVVGHALIVSVE